MEHKNIFNSAADRDAAEKKFRRLSNAFVIAGALGLGTIVAGKVIGKERQTFDSIGALGFAAFIVSIPYCQKTRERLTAAKNDVYKPQP